MTKTALRWTIATALWSCCSLVVPPPCAASNNRPTFKERKEHHDTREEFMRAMEEALAANSARHHRRRDAGSDPTLLGRLLSKATYRTSSSSSSTFPSVLFGQNHPPDHSGGHSSRESHRSLGDMNDDAPNDDWFYADNMYDDDRYNNFDDNVNDDGAADEADNNNNNNNAVDDDNVANYGVPLKNYALKYLGCQNIKAFSDDLAEDGDASSVLKLDKFVVFRFCNADLCSSYNRYGCSHDYGEYVIEMEVYLETMADYHYARYQEYCETCFKCMNQDADGDDAVIFYNFTDDEVLTADATNASDNGFNAEEDCEFYKACYNYKRACYHYGLDDTPYEDFFQCIGYELGNGVVYLGPHCADDSQTIEIGIYNDEDCTEYIGDILDLNEATGLNFADDGMRFYYSPSCVSCTDSGSYGLYNDDVVGNQVYELCGVLYEAAGKCNKYMNLDSADMKKSFQSYVQAQNEKKTCNYIESLVEGHYDEFGEIILGEDAFDLGKWMDYHEYQKYAVNSARKVPNYQIVLMIFSASLMVAMVITSCVMHRTIYKTHTQALAISRPNPVTPPQQPEESTGFFGLGSTSGPATVAASQDIPEEPGRISRISSGIMMGRSSSFHDTPPGYIY